MPHLHGPVLRRHHTSSWPLACACTEEPARDGSLLLTFSEGQKLLKKWSQSPRCCSDARLWKKRPACLPDGHPQPHGAGRSHWEEPCEERVGENPSSCQAAHFPVMLECLQSHQPREDVAPWGIFEHGASKTIVIPPGTRTLHRQPFSTFLATQPASPAERGSQ